jgi:peroxiredoxin family protein
MRDCECCSRNNKFGHRMALGSIISVAVASKKQVSIFITFEMVMQ